VIGCTVFLVTRHHVHGIGRVGMELQQSSIVSVDFYTTKKRMHAIGLKMLADAKNIHFVKTTQMETCHWVDLVIDTGHAKEDIRDCRGVQQC